MSTRNPNRMAMAGIDRHDLPGPPETLNAIPAVTFRPPDEIEESALGLGVRGWQEVDEEPVADDPLAEYLFAEVVDSLGTDIDNLDRFRILCPPGHDPDTTRERLVFCEGVGVEPFMLTGHVHDARPLAEVRDVSRAAAEDDSHAREIAGCLRRGEAGDRGAYLFESLKRLAYPEGRDPVAEVMGLAQGVYEQTREGASTTSPQSSYWSLLNRAIESVPSEQIPVPVAERFMHFLHNRLSTVAVRRFPAFEPLLDRVVGTVEQAERSWGAARAVTPGASEEAVADPRDQPQPEIA